MDAALLSRLGELADRWERENFFGASDELRAAISGTTTHTNEG
jgi:hypothetical protein